MVQKGFVIILSDRMTGFFSTLNFFGFKSHGSFMERTSSKLLPMKIALKPQLPCPATVFFHACALQDTTSTALGQWKKRKYQNLR